MEPTNSGKNRMFNNQDELKAFIAWAKSERILQFKIDGVEITFSNLAFFQDKHQNSDSSINIEVNSSKGQPVSGQGESDDDLFWSSDPN